MKRQRFASADFRDFNGREEGLGPPQQIKSKDRAGPPYLVALSALLLFLTATPSHAHDIVPGTPQSQPILLANGTIHTVSGDTLQSSDLLFENGIITAIGQGIDVPPGTRTINLSGDHVYPGLISSNSTLGLVEINAVRATRDYVESGSLNINARSATAINPDSELIPVTRANGVLVSHVLPQTGAGLFGGTSSIIALDGWTIEEMALETDAGVHIRWPSAPTEPAFRPTPQPVFDPRKADEKYFENIRKLEKAFDDARAFHKAKTSDSESVDVDLRWESLVPVLNKEIPVFVSASKVREIRDAVHWSQKEDIKLVLITSGDAWRVADTLKQFDVSVIVSQVNALPRRRWESYDSVFRNVAKLYAHNIPFAIAFGGGGPTSSNERNLPYEAAKAVAFGLPKEEALKAITLYPAQILGIDDRVGSLETGKQATLIITSGDPLDIRANVKHAFINGRSVDLSSRHTQLFEKYQKKYE